MARPRPILTPTMTKILALHASGLSLKDVASQIYVSYSAVTNMIFEARNRTGTNTTAELILKAHSLGYLSHPTGPDSTVFPLHPLDD